MRPSTLRPAALAVGLFACLAAAPVTSAQSLFVLDEPVLIAAGRRVPLEGAPLRQEPFGRLVLSIPEVGTYTVADRPFEGAQRAGEFDGPTLVFAADGVSIRLRGREPLLGGSRRDAWVLTTPASGARGPARVSLASRADEPSHGPVGNDRDDAEPLRAERTRLRGEVVRLTTEVDRLTSALAQARAERDRLAELTSIQPTERASGEAERDALATELARVRSALTETSGRLRDSEESLRSLRVETDQLRHERDRLTDEASSEASLRAERDRLQAEVASLRGEISDLRQRPAPPQPPTPPRPPAHPSQPTPSAIDPASGASIVFPGFDFGRLANPEHIRQRLDAAKYPPLASRSGLAGDVLVLFQTDPEGRVIRTAVARPLGGGLDALAEELVRAMQFHPPAVGGQSTGLRSQVIVRFSL